MPTLVFLGTLLLAPPTSGSEPPAVQRPTLPPPVAVNAGADEPAVSNLSGESSLPTAPVEAASATTAPEPVPSGTIPDPFAGHHSDEAEPTPSPSERLISPGPFDDQRVARADGDADAERDAKVVRRPEPGMWGLSFGFEGLSTMGLDNPDHSAGYSRFVEVGLRRVFHRGVMPLSAGFGVAGRPVDDPPVGGISGSSGFVWFFRENGRIVPQAGILGQAHLYWSRGIDGWGVAAAPVVGIEFFLVDHVSLLAQAGARLGIESYRLVNGDWTSPGDVQEEASTLWRVATTAGGKLAVTAYF